MMKKNNLVAATSIGLIISFGAVNAQSAVEETIVVEGHRAYLSDFATLEIPQSETILDAEKLLNAGALDLVQALDLSASVARQNNFGGLWNSFSIRGFVGDENLPSNYLVNGFNAGRGFGGPRDLAGIESVEVLKGPRAALFGRGEPGGTINLVTKRPTFQTAGEIKVSAGSFNTLRTDADWTTPLTDQLAVRLVGFYEDAESFRDTIETKRMGFFPSLAYDISNNSKITYELEYSDQEIPFDRGVVAINGELGLISDSNFLGEPGDGPMETEVVGHQLEFQHEFNDEWRAIVGYTQRNTSLEGFSTEASFGSRQQLNVDGQNLSRNRRYRKYDADYRVFRAEISGEFETGNITHRLIVGADIDDFENQQTFLRARPPKVSTNPTAEEQRLINVFNPVYGQFLPTDLGTGTPFNQTFKSSGFFFQDQISLNDRFDIRIGARYDDFEEAEANAKDSRVSPQLGMVFKASDELSLYASYGENFRQLSGRDASGNSFNPNESTSIEAGIKFVLNDGAVFGTATLFRVEQQNILVVDDPSLFTYAALGEADSAGFELDLTANFDGDFSLWASYAYVDAETSNDFFDPNFGAALPAGSALLNVPDQTLSLQLVKDMQVQEKELVLGGGLLYVSDRNGQFNNQDFNLPSYTTVQAFTSFQVTESINIKAEVQNLLDEEYYLNSFASIWVQPGTPRNFRLTVSLSL